MKLINPLNKSVAELNDGIIDIGDMEGAADEGSDESKDAAFASFQVTASMRPNFEPVFPPVHTQRDFDKDGEIVEKILDGYFYDFFVAPVPSARKIRLSQIMKALRSVRRSSEEGAETRGRSASIPEASMLYLYFAPTFASLLETMLDDVYPEEMRPRVKADSTLFNVKKEKKVGGKRGRPKGSKNRKKDTVADDFGEMASFYETAAENEDFDEDFEGDEGADEEVEGQEGEETTVPLDFYSLHEDILKFNKRNIRKNANRIIVKDDGDCFKVTLPVLDLPLGVIFSKLLENVNSNEERIKYIEFTKAFAERLRKYGANILSAGVSDSRSLDWTKIVKDGGRNVPKIPTMKKFIDKYVDSARIRVQPIKKKKDLEDFQRVLRNFGGAAPQQASFKSQGAIEIVDETGIPFDPTEVENVKVEAPDFTDIQFNLENPYKFIDAARTFDSMVNRNITFYVTLNLPKIEAQYYCQTQADKVRAIDVLELFRTLYSNRMLPAIIHLFPLEEVQKMNAGFVPNPRQNSEDLICVDDNRRMYYIPVVSNIEGYASLMTETATRSSGELSFDPELDDLPELELIEKTANKLIYTDWVNNKFVYTNVEGRMQVLDMEKFYPARPHALLRQLNSRIMDYADVTKNQLSALVRFSTFHDNAFGIQFGEFLTAKYNELKASKNNFAEMPHYNRILEKILPTLERAGGTELYAEYLEWLACCVLFDEEVEDNGGDYALAYREIFGGGWQGQKEGNDSTKYQNRLNTVSIWRALEHGFAAPLSEYLDLAVKNAREDIQTYVGKNTSNSVPWMLSALAPWVIITQYRGKRKELREKDEAERAVYMDNDPDKGVAGWKADFMNVSDERRELKGYQGRALSVLDKTPPFAILAIDAGGGKTITIISNILMELEKGNVKRPLVLCPSHLVKDYVAECNFWCDGRVNAIPLNNEVIKNYSQPVILDLVRNAPPNTIFIADYGAFSLDRTTQAYSNEPVDDYRYLNLFRSAGFDGVWCDESHWLKNDSGRSNAVRYAISEIPIKRLATGTFAPNRLVDIVKQFAFFDPTVFGNQKQFIARVQEEVSKTGRIPRDILHDLKSFSMFIHVKRREWAAEMPPRYQSFVPVGTMTPAQEYCYAWLCKNSENNMEMTDKEKKDFDKLFGDTGGKTKVTESSEDSDQDKSDDDDDESNDEKMHKMFGVLERNLSHIEMFLAAPKYHPLAKEVNPQTGKPYLPSPEDLRSPKSDVIWHHFNNHLRGVTVDYDNNEETEESPGGFFGKVLVFTNWQRSVHQFYEDLPSKMTIPVKEGGKTVMKTLPKKEVVMKYSATTKVDDFQKFKTTDNIRMMIGIGKSMNTGLNLQFCSRLIITESVWTPGELEQSLARVFRPVKIEFDAQGNRVPDRRKKVFINHIVVNRTIDVLKTANLISKWVTVTKTLNADNPIYDPIPEVKEIKLRIKDLFSNDWDFHERCAEHGQAFQTMLYCEYKDNDEFKLKYPEKLVPYPVTNKGTLPGSKLLAKVPYVPGQTIVNSKDLNLTPWNEWKAAWIAENGWFDVKRIIEEMRKDNPNWELWVHTEMGDGRVWPRKAHERKGKQVEGEEDFDEADEDFADTNTMEKLPSEKDVFEKVLKQRDVEYETEDAEGTKAKNVVVAFDLATAEFDPNLQKALDIVGDKVKITERQITIPFPASKVFVINDTVIPNKSIRKAVLQMNGDIPVQDVELDYQGRIKKGKEKVGKLWETINKLMEKMAKGNKKDKELIDKLRKRQQMSDDQLENTKRKRGRPPKVRDEDVVQPKRGPGRPPKVREEDVMQERQRPGKVNIKKVVVPTTDTELNGAIELFVTQNGDTLSLALSKRDPDVNVSDLNSVIRNSEFVNIPPYLSVHIANKKQLKTLLNALVPTFEDGTPITPDAPVIPQRIYDKLEWIPARGRSGGYFGYKDYKYPRSIIENGHFVFDKSELPDVVVTDKTRENLLSLKNLLLKNLQGSTGSKIVLPRAKINELKALNLLLKQKKPGVEGILNCFGMNVSGNLYICVPVTMNTKSSLNAFKQMCAEAGVTPALQKNDIIAFYQDKQSLVADVRSIMENYDITNIDEVREDSARIITGMRGKPSAGF